MGIDDFPEVELLEHYRIWIGRNQAVPTVYRVPHNKHQTIKHLAFKPGAPLKWRDTEQKVADKWWTEVNKRYSEPISIYEVERMIREFKDDNPF